MGIDSECHIPSKCLHGIFSPDNLTSNNKKLHQYYERKLSPDELDERHFIQSDKRNFTPFKMSPFDRNTNLRRPMPPTPSKQPITDVEDKANLEPSLKRHLASSRVLNYEQSSQDGPQITLNQKLMEIKFPQRVPNSPYSIK